MRTPAGFSIVRITSIYPFPGRSLDCALGAFALRGASENLSSRHSGTSVSQSTLEDSPTPPAVPCKRSYHANARDDAFGKSTADVLLTKPLTRTSSAFPFYGICRKNREPTSGLEPLTYPLYE